MNTAIINIKTQPEVKLKAQEIARKLGLSLSSLINGFLRQFVKTKKITFSLDEKPNEYFRRTLTKARKSWKEGKGSPVFHTGREAVKWLEEQGI